jgi:hypothetical protein
MEHLSNWHDLDPADLSTYPQVAHKVQVRFRSGKTQQGDRSVFFPRAGMAAETQINGWRYIKDDSVD